MKLDARQIPGFLRDPGACRLALLYGEDEGLIREHAQSLTRRIAGSLNDPFLVAELSREGWAQIPSEMASLSMIGGRRVVRVRDATDAVLGPVAEALKGPGQALLVLEAPGLGKGKLRSYAEASPAAVAIACYPEEGRALTELVRSTLADMQVSADAETMAWLGEVLGGDRAVVRAEIEKLALYAGPAGRIDAEMARLCLGEPAGRAGDDALSSAMQGDISNADAAVEAAIADGLTGVAVVRIGLQHLQKMHQARLRMEAGLSAADAVRTMRPPVFYKAVGGMTAALTLWPSDGLLRAIEESRQVELACKRTGSRQELLARRYITWLARQSLARKARG